MKIIGAIIALLLWLFICFVSMSHAQDLFDLAEIEFDIDYIDIAGIEIFGNKKSGQVMAVWMKNGDVLTKTLSKSKIKYNNREDREFDNGGDYNSPPPGAQGHSYGNDPYDKPSISDLRKKTKEELILRANDLINGEWETQTTFRLFNVIFALKLEGNRGSEMAKLTMDVINANLKYENRPLRLLGERDMLLSFAEGDEELTKQTNEFLENNGFNKENY